MLYTCHTSAQEVVEDSWVENQAGLPIKIFMKSKNENQSQRRGIRQKMYRSRNMINIKLRP